MLGTDSVGETLPKEESFCLRGHDGPVLAVRFNNPGTYCLSCGKDRSIRLWNPHKGLLIKTYAGHGYDVRDAVVSADNSKFASCGGDRQIFLWDVGTGRTIRKFRGHDGVVNSVCLGPGEGTLVTGGYDQAVRVWDMRSRSVDAIQTIKSFADSVTSVAVSPNAEILAACVDGTVRRFDVRGGCVYVDQMHAPVTSMALSHDGNCVLASCLDTRLRLLDKASGELLAEYKGHKQESAKMDCALTPSDAHVLSGSEDGRVCYWDLVEETMVESFQAHSGVVCSLVVHPDGDMLLTSSTDGTVKVWH
ncbi:hypothetical protein WJX75_006744 [Coccomyxa subellipsoidea]|uniref:WD40 repeat-like protein n=1 Tax=Coccomyxa subellipsoidea TaxID=248742 RepID=A0ABR2YX88_9CHLO